VRTVGTHQKARRHGPGPAILLQFSALAIPATKGGVCPDLGTGGARCFGETLIEARAIDHDPWEIAMILGSGGQHTAHGHHILHP